MPDDQHSEHTLNPWIEVTTFWAQHNGWLLASGPMVGLFESLIQAIVGKG